MSLSTKGVKLELMTWISRLISDMVKVIYRETDPRLHGAAALSVTRFGAQSSIPGKQEVDTFLQSQAAQGH